VNFFLELFEDLAITIRLRTVIISNKKNETFLPPKGWRRTLLFRHGVVKRDCHPDSVEHEIRRALSEDIYVQDS